MSHQPESARLAGDVRHDPCAQGAFDDEPVRGGGPYDRLAQLLVGAALDRLLRARAGPERCWPPRPRCCPSLCISAPPGAVSTT
ncbi:hypothetical protein ACFWIO_12295 [Streptomyces diastatochromogenes]|uniref:hypothetical protein n=1 Tax=Streptomyces diastatochromogenes TaxID=42236 RepID=UPI0036641269